MHLSPVILERAYDFLRSTAPFSDWDLPEADEVEFHIHRHRDNRFGDHAYRNGRHVIRLSDRRHNNYTVMLQTMAHEMGHLYQRQTDCKSRLSADHGPKFMRLMRRVGRRWGWKPEII